MANVDNPRARSSAAEPRTRGISDKRSAQPERSSALRRTVAAACSAALFAAVSLTSAEADAQVSTMYLDRLFIGGAPEDAIGLWRPHFNPQTRFFGQLGMGFGLNPFRIENHADDPRDAAVFNRDSGAPVRAQVISYLGVGVEILERVSIQANLPIILFQTGNSTYNADVTGSQAVNLSTAAAMDMRLDGRVRLFQSSTKAFKLGLEGAVWLPTGNHKAFAGDGSVGGGFQLAAEYDLKSFFLVFNTGFQFRPPGGVNDFKSGSEWRWGAGGFLPLRGGTLRLGAQIFGSTGITSATFFDVDNTPIEWLAEGRYAFDQKKRAWLGLGGGTRFTPGYAPDFRLVATVGYAFPIKDVNPPSPGKRFKTDRYAEHGADTDKDGLPDDIDLCPTEPEDKKPPNPDDGCPTPPDRDGDGIPDSADKCPDTPEDFDKVDDQDGCPEDDPDKDGIGDAKDACPKEPGEQNADAEKNGCPNFIRRISGSNEIQILKKVEFTTGKSTILTQSYPILDEVVRLLKVNPEIKHLAIEGHTDNRGSDDLNEKLSTDRSNAVMEYLIKKGGIAADRLSAAGFGPRRPIADNNTGDGRQKNRRVEFHIRDKGAEGSTVSPGQ
jgi:OmpA-OmpF porin, OOP family